MIADLSPEETLVARRKRARQDAFNVHMRRKTAARQTFVAVRLAADKAYDYERAAREHSIAEAIDVQTAEVEAAEAWLEAEYTQIEEEVERFRIVNAIIDG